jgi:hypothetical protein
MKMKRRINKNIVFFILLLLFTILTRVQYQVENTFDSYTLHGQVSTILKYGYAKWILHPASLFGYYPLSSPSGNQFFLGNFVALTGINIDNTIRITSVIFTLISLLNLYVLIKNYMHKIKAYIILLVFVLTPYFMSFTNYNASSRVFLIIFYSLFMFMLLKIYNSLFLEKFRFLIFFKYSFMAFILLLYSALAHRTVQILFIIIGAFVLCIIYTIIFRLPQFWNFIKKSKHYDLILKRYNESKKYIIIDAFIIFLVLSILKLLDLLRRHRFLINIIRLKENLLTYYISIFGKTYSDYLIIITIAIILFQILILIWIFYLIILRHTKDLIPYIDSIYLYGKKFSKKVLKNTNLYFWVIVLFLMTYWFFGSFFGQSDYSPSFGEYYESSLFSGSSPVIVFLNFIINFITTISPFSPLVIVSIIYIIFKKEKNIFELLIIFCLLGFSQFLIDKRYFRLFIIPIWSIFVGIGIYFVINYLFKKIKNRSKIKWIIVSLLIFNILLSFFILYRTYIITGQQTITSNQKVDALTKVIKEFNIKNSIYASYGKQTNVKIFSRTTLPGPDHNIYIFGNTSQIVPEKKTFSGMIDALKKGDLKEMWVAPDWYFGGQYYWGKHGIHFLTHSYNDKYSKRIINDYNIGYYVYDRGYEDDDLEEEKLYTSIKFVKNKIYDNPTLSMWDIKRGRDFS